MISIIVPVYNVEKYLIQCLDSLLMQEYRNLEIILVDDGSTDRCPQICEDFAKRDPRIKVIHKENEGLVCARKTGMQAASGEYIGYVDGDDWIEPDMYGRMYRRMTQENVDIVMCGRYEDTGSFSKKVYHGVLEGRYDKEQMLQNIYPKMIASEEFFDWRIFPSVWDKLFKRECIEKFQMSVDQRLKMGEDAACVYPCLLNAESIYVMHECLYHYRQTTASMVKKIQNYEAEKLQFSLLYQTVNDSLEKYASIYDLRKQWKKYVLFLMIPRADGLLDGYGELDYLFPFSGIKKGTDIILYGAGTYGQRLYRYLQKTAFCRVTAWVDRNYLQFRKWGLPVEPPYIVGELYYDAVAIANTYAGSRFGLYQELIERIDKDKVFMIDEQLIFSENSMRRFGLLEGAMEGMEDYG